MSINYLPVNNLYNQNNPNNIIPFRGKTDFAQKIFVLKTPKKGLVKHNSFLHPNLKLVTKPDGEKGVFATGKIKKDEIVCIFVGDFLTGKEVSQLPQSMQCKTLQVAGDIFQIGSKDPENLKAFDAAEHFNHSCQPNLFLTGNNILVAERRIKKGEELFYDYGTSDTFGNPDTVAGWKCTCGAPNCRGENNPEAYKKIIPDLAKKYGLDKALNMVADYIAKIYTSIK